MSESSLAQRCGAESEPAAGALEVAAASAIFAAAVAHVAASTVQRLVGAASSGPSLLGVPEPSESATSLSHDWGGGLPVHSGTGPAHSTSSFRDSEDGSSRESEGGEHVSGHGSEAGAHHTTSSGLNMVWVLSPTVRYVALFGVLLACLLSLSDIRDHLQRLDYPQIQVLEMRILAMIPIYAVLSIGSLFFPTMRFFLVTVRDTYESFVLYMFLLLLLALCGGEGQLLRSLRAKRYKGVHPFPFCYLPTYPLDRSFYLRCKRLVLQCALIKPLCAFIAMVTVPLGLYDEGRYGFDNIYTYVFVVINISLSYALYYLVLFEIELDKELFYAKPFLKFLSIKSIVFFCFWQSMVVSKMISFGLLYVGEDHETYERVGNAMQDLLVCIELLPVAMLHHAAFNRDKLDEEMAAVPVYMKSNSGTATLGSNVDTALSIKDVVEDTLATIFYRRGKLVDQENEDYAAWESDGDMNPYDAGMRGGAGRDAGSGPGTADLLFGMQAGGGGGIGDVDMTMITLGRDPTLDELVRHAVITDYGVRVDGILHYDEDSDREERNDDMNYTDTDVMLRRSRRNVEAAAGVAVDVDILRSQQQQSSAPSIYCVVCGRFDREMVRRRNGYKCRECIGTKSKSLLREHQKEIQQLPHDTSGEVCATCGRSDVPVVTRGNTVRCINCLNDATH